MQKSKFTKLLCLVLSLLMVLCAAPLTAFAADETVKYIYREWNETTKTVVEKENEAIAPTILTGMLSNDNLTLKDGQWYAVKGSAFSLTEKLTVQGTVNLILTDESCLYAWKGIEVAAGQTLVIYNQAGGTGKLEAGQQGGRIGGSENISCGTVIVHGGIINAADGIGGGENGAGGTVTVYSGSVTATAKNGAGIGGGNNGAGGTVTVYGGNVTATGDRDCAGIGGGNNGAGGTVTVYGGNVTATGEGSGSGIGGGYLGTGGTVTVYGGNVTATGKHGGAGIGSGDYAGSNNGTGGTVTINGGTVVAEAISGGAGIGGGEATPGANVTINGGTVTAIGRRGLGYGNIPIGGGLFEDTPGTVTVNGDPAVRNTKTSSGSVTEYIHFHEYTASYTANADGTHVGKCACGEADTVKAAHTFVNGVCSVCKAVCIHTFEKGVCTICEFRCTHNFENGTCTVCGMAEKITVGELYNLLFYRGYINNSNGKLWFANNDGFVETAVGIGGSATNEVSVTSYGYSWNDGSVIYNCYVDADGISKIICPGLSPDESRCVYYAWHNVKEVPAKAATCTENGAMAYWVCQDAGCGKAFDNKYCATEIAAADLANYIVSATGHSFTGDYVPGTGDNAGKHARKCVNTGCTAVGLDGTANAYEAHTGMNDFTCDLCGYYDEAAALAGAKTTAKATVNALAGEGDSDAVKAIVAKAVEDIEAATGEAAIEAIVSTAETAVADQKAAEEAAAALAEAKKEAEEWFLAPLNTLSLGYYSPALVAELIEGLDELTSPDGIEQYKADSVGAILEAREAAFEDDAYAAVTDEIEALAEALGFDEEETEDILAAFDEFIGGDYEGKTVEEIFGALATEFDDAADEEAMSAVSAKFCFLLIVTFNSDWMAESDKDENDVYEALVRSLIIFDDNAKFAEYIELGEYARLGQLVLEGYPDYIETYKRCAIDDDEVFETAYSDLIGEITEAKAAAELTTAKADAMTAVEALVSDDDSAAVKVIAEKALADIEKAENVAAVEAVAAAAEKAVADQKAAEALAKAKTEAKATVNSLVADPSDAMKAILTKACEDIELAGSVEAINAIIEALKAEIPVRKEKDSVIADAQKYLNSSYESVRTLAEKFVEKIEACTTVTQVKNARGDIKSLGFAEDKEEAYIELNALVTDASSDAVKAIVEKAIDDISNATGKKIQTIKKQAIADVNAQLALEAEIADAVKEITAFAEENDSDAVKAIIAGYVAQAKAVTVADALADIVAAAGKAAAEQKAAEALAKAKTEAKTAVEALADNNASDEVKAIIEKALADIEDAEDIAAVEAVAAAAEKAVAEQRKTEEAIALAEAKQAAKDEIDAAAGDDDSAKVLAAVEEAKAAVDAAQTIKEVEAAKAAGLEKIANATAKCPYCGSENHNTSFDRWYCFFARIILLVIRGVKVVKNLFEGA